MTKNIHIFGGGTFSHVRSHLALAAPAFGTTARSIWLKLHENTDYQVYLELTKMASISSDMVTNDDVERRVDELIANPDTKIIFFNVALCDYDGAIIEANLTNPSADFLQATESGKYAERLKTSDGNRFMQISPANKIIGKIRRERKDIFVVGFKTTANATHDEQYAAGLNLLKSNSINLVLANDIVTRRNIIITPEESYYGPSEDRDFILNSLIRMALERSENTFTRSTVVDGHLHDFQKSIYVPDNIRDVVNYVTERGAYKPFNGATVGHFAVKVDDNVILTSRRKTNYTEPHGLDLVEIHYEGLDKVIAFGAKPSVGGQSQRIIFDEHKGAECIVHFHCPLKDDAPMRDKIGAASQWLNECGSHQCGKNTSDNLKSIAPDIKAVMLENHGPNIVFNRYTDHKKIIQFIEENFDLEQKTGGLIHA